MSTDDGVVVSVGRKRRPLGFFSVVALIFFEVAGGPFGIEVRSSADVLRGIGGCAV